MQRGLKPRLYDWVITVQVGNPDLNGTIQASCAEQALLKMAAQKRPIFPNEKPRQVEYQPAGAWSPIPGAGLNVSYNESWHLKYYSTTTCSWYTTDIVSIKKVGI